ncbi:hypothetical protein GQ44DRAFT_709636 [Phaeosphaeriaceae sp. PMI808]|nr:hypothetical protein GQ44DRAFT_709636 [Phaeosphaeriaceae sp. PMI808]
MWPFLKERANDVMLGVWLMRLSILTLSAKESQGHWLQNLKTLPDTKKEHLILNPCQIQFRFTKIWSSVGTAVHRL